MAELQNLMCIICGNGIQQLNQQPPFDFVVVQGWYIQLVFFLVPVLGFGDWPHQILTGTGKTKQETKLNFHQISYTLLITSCIASIGLRNCNFNCLWVAARSYTFGFHQQIQKWRCSLLLIMNLPIRLWNRKNIGWQKGNLSNFLTVTSTHLLNLLIFMFDKQLHLERVKLNRVCLDLGHLLQVYVSNC